MSKILILAQAGFGKSTAIGPVSREDFKRSGIDAEIKGLDPKKTFIISVTNKGLPIPRWKTFYKTTPIDEFIRTGIGNRVVTNDGDKIATVINLVASRRSDIQNIVIDDSNYIMQDLYMSKNWSGYDIFRKLGAIMGKIFNAMETVDAANKNFIMIAHMEEYKDSNSDTISYRFKTVGKMVQDYITPEGKFEIVLFGKQSIDEKDGKKTIIKQFVTNYDGQYPAKAPVGMFDDIYIPNDLGLVMDYVREYEG